MASIFFPFRILLCFCILLPLGSLGFVCPGPYYPSQGFSYARIESNISGRVEEMYEQIRIKLFFDPSIEGKPYKALVQEATDFWSSVLSVKPVDGRIFMSRDCKSENEIIYKDLDGSGKKERYCLGSCNETTQCLDIEVQKEHLDGCKYCTQEGQNCTKDQPEPGTGVENADLVFYVTAINTETCLENKPVAYAGYCDVEPVLDRPVFAVINICPEEVKQHSNDRKTMLRTIKHEMMHPLGFSGQLFSLFRDKQGKPLWPRDKNEQPINKDRDNAQQKVLKTIARKWHVRGKVIKSEHVFLVTPSVVKEARNHFDCPELEGAELEDFGGEGTRKSHFEGRVFHDDAMKGNMNTGKGLFSRLDFAVLEDSGWYKVDYSQAEEMDFGRNLSCDFCMKSCKFWMDKKRKERQSIEPFCETTDIMNGETFSCDGPNFVFSGCPLTEYEPDLLKELHDPNSNESVNELPQKYQNFDKIRGVKIKDVPKYGSLDQQADFCPILVEKMPLPVGNDQCGEKSENDPNQGKKHQIEGKQDRQKNEVHQQSNHSSRLGSCVLFVSLLAWISIML